MEKTPATAKRMGSQRWWALILMIVGGALFAWQMLPDEPRRGILVRLSGPREAQSGEEPAPKLPTIVIEGVELTTPGAQVTEGSTAAMLAVKGYVEGGEFSSVFLMEEGTQIGAADLRRDEWKRLRFHIEALVRIPALPVFSNKLQRFSLEIRNPDQTIAASVSVDRKGVFFSPPP